MNPIKQTSLGNQPSFTFHCKPREIMKKTYLDNSGRSWQVQKPWRSIPSALNSAIGDHGLFSLSLSLFVTMACFPMPSLPPSGSLLTSFPSLTWIAVTRYFDPLFFFLLLNFSAHFYWQKIFTHRRSFLPLLSCNHRPSVRFSNQGIPSSWLRVHLCLSEESLKYQS